LHICIIVTVLMVLWRLLRKGLKLWRSLQNSSFMDRAAAFARSSNGQPLERTSSSSMDGSFLSILRNSDSLNRNGQNVQRDSAPRSSNSGTRSRSPRRIPENNLARREYANRLRMQALQRQISIIEDHLRAVNHVMEAITMLLNADRAANQPNEPLMLMNDEDPHWAVSWVTAFEWDQAQGLTEPWSPTVLEESISENERLYESSNNE